MGQQLERARDVLHQTFGHSDFRDGQAEVVTGALAGRNLLVVMPTGSGKSLLYQLPALVDDGLTLVISPLIALMKDQVDELQRKGVAAAFINSSLSPEMQRQTIDQCLAGTIRLLYVAPERFRSSSFARMLEQVKLSRLAVDEAHCISQWGHDFRPDYRRIKEFRRQMGNPVVTALTATATPQVQQDIIAALGLTPDEIEVHVRGFDRPNLKLRVVRSRNDNEKIRFLREFLRSPSGVGTGIVYVGTRRAAEEVTQELRSIEPSVTMYHAGLEPEDRARSQEAFLSGTARIAVATVAFGMGIDKADVRFVVHYHFPGSVEQYYQEIGRAGRDGLPSQCVLLYCSGDRFLREFFIDLSYPTRDQVRSVMKALYSVRANPVMLTYRQLAERCDESIKDGQVGPALRLMAGAKIARMLEGNAAAAITLDVPGAEILGQLRGKVQRSVFEALAIVGDLETPGEFQVDLDQVARAAGLTAAQVQRALTALDAAGHIAYHPPFRGRGVQKLMDTLPQFEQADFDWETHEFLRSLEEKKLQAMEAYIHSQHCRRAFIVKYFGEDKPPVCNDCDRCERGEQKAAGGDKAAGGVLGREPQVAAAALVCVRDLRFSLGVGRIAKVITGSRESKLLKWGLDGNLAYNAARCSRDAAKDVIDQLAAEGYLRTSGEYDRPTLELTPKGQEAADDIDPADLRGPAPTRTVESSPGSPPPPTHDVTQAALQCVDELPSPVGVTRVAEVLTGSHAKWIATGGADQLSVYNCIRQSQNEVRDAIRGMIAEGLLTQTARGRYPVLELTEAGREAMTGEPVAAGEAIETIETIETVTTPQPIDTPDEPTESPSRPPQAEEPDLHAAMTHSVEQVLGADRDAAAAALDALRLLHPVRLAGALAERYSLAAADRQKTRAVWAAGALCGVEALAMLKQAAESPDDTLRGEAAKALGKMAARLCNDAIAINRDMPGIHQALQRLLDDDSPTVRQAANEAASSLTGGG